MDPARTLPGVLRTAVLTIALACLGLGLAVARGFARAIGGEIRIEETPGGGATLLVELAVAAARVSEEATP